MNTTYSNAFNNISFLLCMHSIACTRHKDICCWFVYMPLTWNLDDGKKEKEKEELWSILDIEMFSKWQNSLKKEATKPNRKKDTIQFSSLDLKQLYGNIIKILNSANMCQSTIVMLFVYCPSHKLSSLSLRSFMTSKRRLSLSHTNTQPTKKYAIFVFGVILRDISRIIDD